MILGHQKAQTANWKHIDSSVRQHLNAWNEPAPVFERRLLPHELFEFFLTNTEMERICVESTNYDRLKAFLVIILVNGYTRLPRQERYWEKREDYYNLVVSVMTTKKSTSG